LLNNVSFVNSRYTKYLSKRRIEASVMTILVLYLSAALSFGQEAQPQPTETPQTQTVSFPAAAGPALERPSAANPPAPLTSPERWEFMKFLQGTGCGSLLDDSRIAVSGWMDAGATFGSAGSNNLPLGFNFRDNDFSLQQNWVRIDRPIVTSGTTEPTFGFRSDTILPGTDYRFTIARGLFSDQLTGNHGQPDIYGIDPVQAYGEAYFPTIAGGLDVKLGRFYGQYGVESIEAPGNALFSHAYTFLDNPFTQTGVLATVQLTSAWSLEAGLVMGEDLFFVPGEEPTFIGNVKWAPPRAPDSVTLSVILDSGRFDQRHNLNNPDILDLVFTHRVDGRLAWSVECLAGYQTHLAEIGTTTWSSIVNYLSYDFTGRLSGTARLEFFNDPNGERTGSRGQYMAVTAGLNYHPLKSVIFRPEIRYDYNDETACFEGQHGLFTAAADLILRW
jgi:Putative beta-barrel porin-2, OmpL-like. bbp2